VYDYGVALGQRLLAKRSGPLQTEPGWEHWTGGQAGGASAETRTAAARGTCRVDKTATDYGHYHENARPYVVGFVGFGQRDPFKLSTGDTVSKI